jgi:trehalose 6-phosphate synthase/phosphatase
MAARSRFVIASNRLPVTLQADSGEPALQPAAGGLAAALQAMHRHGEVTWVGWPGDTSALSARDHRRVMERLSRDRIVPVELSKAEQAEYYDGVCNGVLWPVLHYLIDRMPVELPDFRLYRAVNDRFAAAIVRAYRPGDVIWIHDYHLLLVPAIVRMRLPDAHIGLFVHTSFPSPEVFRVLPWRRELLEGMLGASLVGLQTDRDAGNFADAVGALTEWRAEGRTIAANGREIRIGTYPIEIDTDPVEAVEPPSTLPAVIPPTGNGRRLLAGVDRLDYTKGITQRLAAYRKLLTDDASARGRVELLQVAVPSRTTVWHYQALRLQVEALVKGINDAFGTAGWTPIRYVYHSLTPSQVQAIYRACDVMLVTSIRDGMNLVAKEFVAARTDDDGVLILSEFTGAADQLHEALLVNPYSVDDIAAAMSRALAMEAGERQARMKALRRGVQGGSVERWVSRFTRDLLRESVGVASDRAAPAGALQQYLSSDGGLSLVLMYEALVPRRDGDGTPDPDLVETLVRLSSTPGIGLHIVSDRDHETLDEWFDRVPAVLWAEHGTWRRECQGRRWRRTGWFSTEWMEDVRELFRQFTATTPGAFIEERPLTLSWKFGRAERAGGRAQALTLSSLLRDAAHALGYSVVQTENSVDVRPATLGFARTLNKIIEGGPPWRLAVFHAPGFDGDARDALRASDVAVQVDDPFAIRALLRDAQDWTMMPLRTA